DDNEVVGIAGEVAGLEVAGVGFFEICDAGIVTEFGMELAVADVDAGGGGGSGLEGAIGEAAGGGADVEEVAAAAIDGEGGEGAFEFFAAAADEAGWLPDFDGGILGEGFAGFVEDFGADAYFAAEDDGFGLGAGLG